MTITTITMTAIVAILSIPVILGSPPAKAEMYNCLRYTNYCSFHRGAPRGYISPPRRWRWR